MKRETLVGGFFFLGLFIFVFMTVMIDERYNPFRPRGYMLRAYFDTTAGLEGGDDVRLAGKKVGAVKDVKVHSDNVEVDFELDPGTVIKEDAKAIITMNSLMGGRHLSIDLGTPEAKALSDGETLKNSVTSASMADVMAKVGSAFDEFEKLGKRLNGIVGDDKFENSTVGKLVTKSDLYDDIKRITEDIKGVTANLRDGKGTVGKLMADETVYNDVKSAVSDLKAVAENAKGITDDLRQGKGTIGKLLTDESVYNDVKKLLKGASEGIEDAREQAPISAFTSVMFGALK